jgi:hypothetical protein
MSQCPLFPLPTQPTMLHDPLAMTSAILPRIVSDAQRDALVQLAPTSSPASPLLIPYRCRRLASLTSHLDRRMIHV